MSGKIKAQQETERGVLLWRYRHLNNSITLEKINLTFLRQHKLKHQQCAASCEEKNRLQHHQSNVICLYRDSQQAKGHVFLNQHYKMDLWAQVQLSTVHPGLSRLQNTLESVPSDNNNLCKSLTGQPQQTSSLSIYIYSTQYLACHRFCCCVLLWLIFV